MSSLGDGRRRCAPPSVVAFALPDRTLVQCVRGRRPKPLDEGSGVTGFDCPGSAGAAIIRPHIQSSSGIHLKNGGKPGSDGPKIIPRAAHNVSRDEVSDSALKVLYRLNKAGYQAFLVGG